MIIVICNVRNKRPNLQGEVTAVLGTVIQRNFEIHFDGHGAYHMTAQYPCEVLMTLRSNLQLNPEFPYAALDERKPAYHE